VRSDEFRDQLEAALQRNSLHFHGLNVSRSEQRLGTRGSRGESDELRSGRLRHTKTI
jgi:hypothetical protein